MEATENAIAQHSKKRSHAQLFGNGVTGAGVARACFWQAVCYNEFLYVVLDAVAAIRVLGHSFAIANE